MLGKPRLMSYVQINHRIKSDNLFLKHACSILRVIQPCMWFMEEAIQFSMGQTARRLTCSTMKKPQYRVG